MRMVLTLLLILTFNVAAHGGQKVALVIGNNAYGNAPDVANAGLDAESVSQSFERLGFDVALIENAGFNALRAALSNFAVKAAGAEMSVIYYSGHGLSMNDKNYIVPTDAKLSDAVVAAYELISLDSILWSMRGSNGLKLVFLDASRDNPFRETANSNTAPYRIGQGLASVDPGSGMVISLSAKPGTYAVDSGSKFSVYTTALLKTLETRDVTLQTLFQKIRAEVIRHTEGRQEPVVFGSVPSGRVYFGVQQQSPLKPVPSLVLLAAHQDPGAMDLDIGGRALANQVQAELNRVGCDAGFPDGFWGKNSRDALTRYLRSAGVAHDSFAPTLALLTLLRNDDVRVCQSKCLPNEVPIAGQCTVDYNPDGQIACKPGQRRDAEGRCYTMAGNNPGACASGQSRDKNGNCPPRTSRAGKRESKSKPVGRRRFNPWSSFECRSDGLGGMNCD